MQRQLLIARWQKIYDIVTTRGSMTILELCAEVGMSANTVRRDVEILEKRGLVAKTRGRVAACSALAMHDSHSLAESRVVLPECKTRIGRAAARLVKAEATVMIDGGFTTYQVAKHIREEKVRIVTNSLDVATVFAARNACDLTVVGGELWQRSGSIVGWTAHEQISRLNADIAILGTDAVSCREGLTCVYSETAIVKKAMSERSKELILVADHSKLGRFCKNTWSDISRLAVLVTDDQADPALLTEFEAAGVRIVVAAD